MEPGRACGAVLAAAAVRLLGVVGLLLLPELALDRSLRHEAGELRRNESGGPVASDRCGPDGCCGTAMWCARSSWPTRRPSAVRCVVGRVVRGPCTSNLPAPSIAPA